MRAFAPGPPKIFLPQDFSRFNEALSPVERRLKDGKPFSAIRRWRVVTDDDGNTAAWLFIYALRGKEICPCHSIAGSYPEANALARRCADDIERDYD